LAFKDPQGWQVCGGAVPFKKVLGDRQAVTSSHAYRSIGEAIGPPGVGPKYHFAHPASVGLWGEGSCWPGRRPAGVVRSRGWPRACGSALGRGWCVAGPAVCVSIPLLYCLCFCSWFAQWYGLFNQRQIAPMTPVHAASVVPPRLGGRVGRLVGPGKRWAAVGGVKAPSSRQAGGVMPDGSRRWRDS